MALKLLTKGCNRSNRQYTLYGKTAVYIIPGFNGCYARFPLDGLGILAIRDQVNMSRGVGQMRIEINVFHIYMETVLKLSVKRIDTRQAVIEHVLFIMGKLWYTF
jgi:hypothetical protein